MNKKIVDLTMQEVEKLIENTNFGGHVYEIYCEEVAYWHVDEYLRYISKYLTDYHFGNDLYHGYIKIASGRESDFVRAFAKLEKDMCILWEDSDRETLERLLEKAEFYDELFYMDISAKNEERFLEWYEKGIDRLKKAFCAVCEAEYESTDDTGYMADFVLTGGYFDDVYIDDNGKPYRDVRQYLA